MSTRQSSINEIESLIYLLDDPDPTVQSGVKNRFKELGEHAVPLLDQFRSESVKDSEKKSINEVLYYITIESLFEDFSELIEFGIKSRADLEDALLLLARFGNPTLRTGEYRRKLDALSAQISSKVANTPSVTEKMQIILHFVFRELRFRGDADKYHNLDNAYLDRVIDRRKGLPIMLSMIVVFIAQRLGLPFYGVNMPIHFMLLYETHNQQILIDPFDGGTIVTYNQCFYFLKKNGIDPRPEHLQKADYREVLLRTIRNLINSYSKVNETRKMEDLHKLLHIIDVTK